MYNDRKCTAFCPECGQPVTYYFNNGVISKPEEYVLIADWIFHAVCWDKKVEDKKALL